jgi:hypothetical protein
LRKATIFFELFCSTLLEPREKKRIRSGGDLKIKALQGLGDHLRYLERIALEEKWALDLA